MADLVIVSANVGMTTTAPSTKTVTYGETVTEGQAVYLKAADGLYWLTVVTAAESAQIAGIAMTPGAAGEKGTIATKGDFECGAATTLGEIYVLGGAAGAIAPVADLASLDYVTIVGFGQAATNVMLLDFTITGMLKP